MRLRELEREEAERKRAEEEAAQKGGRGVGGLIRNIGSNIPILGQRKP
jgi:hypothetical protein